MFMSEAESCKKRKRRPAAPPSPSSPPPNAAFSSHSMDFSGPFRDSVRRFLGDQPRDRATVDGRPTWHWRTVVSSVPGSDVVVPLYTVEEDVQGSPRPFCDECRCVGWSHHFVSKRRYHFIIPRESEWTKPMSGEILELDTHLLHGMIHCNGFGHLLSINGIEKGSYSIGDEELMDLWDRICAILRPRKITVHNTSRKRSMELRLLYELAHGRSWFAKWGYKFNLGSFGVTKDKYDRALEVLGSLDLTTIVQDCIDTSHGRAIQQIIRKYEHASESRLVTISDLLKFVLAFKHKHPIQKKTTMEGYPAVCFESPMVTDNRKPLQLKTLDNIAPALSANLSRSYEEKSTVDDNSANDTSSISALPVAELYSRWPTKRLEHAAKIIVNTLKEHKADAKGHKSMSRQELRDAVRLYIGDTGLIDFVIKNIDNTIVGSRIVRRKMNPRTKTLEFTVQEAGKAEKLKDRESLRSRSPALEQEFDIYKDLLCLYENILFGYPDSHPVSLATQVILDHKHFVKEWKFANAKDEKFMRITCRVMPTYAELVSHLTRPLPPGELVDVPQCATNGELKLAVQRALRDTYVIMDQFIVREVKACEMQVRDDQQVQHSVLESQMEVLVRGGGLDLESELRYEGGTDNWMVLSRATDDNSERVVACDVCQGWQHTLCAGIKDDEDVPSMFICGRCNAAKHNKN
ncbi:PHD domain-containing protein [Psidium guajava]|nr:PHD domain-containing protein [Psidium guajava]